MTAARSTPTMTKVAHAAGVSVTTVSHVINRTRPVAPETERAVLEAMARVGYLGAGRSMGRLEAMTIGLAMSAMSNPYFGVVVQALEQRASQDGYSLLLADTHDEPAGELRAMKDLLQRGVVGVILAPSADPGTSLGYARAQNVPVVLIDRLLPLDVDQIGTENVQSTAILAEHLASLGHERIGLVSGRRGLATSDERVEGFRAGLLKGGRRVDERLIVSGDSSDTAAEAAVRKLLKRSKPPTAVVVGNNLMTIGVMRALRAEKIRVPEDLAIAVFDDFDWADAFHPRLTAIAQPTFTIGQQAMELLTSRIAEPDLPTRRIQVQPAFVHRESCGCPEV